LSPHIPEIIQDVQDGIENCLEIFGFPHAVHRLVKGWRGDGHYLGLFDRDFENDVEDSGEVRVRENDEAVVCHASPQTSFYNIVIKVTEEGLIVAGCVDPIGLDAVEWGVYWLR